MEEDFDDEYGGDEVEYEEEDTVNNELEDELEEEGEDDIEDDVSEIYRPKVEKKIDPIARMNVKPRSVIIVSPEDRITDNRLHENEASFILSTRAEEIAKNATCFANNKTYTNAATAAYYELMEHRCPFKLRRQVGISSTGDIIVEEWDVNTMVLPNIPSL